MQTYTLKSCPECGGKIKQGVSPVNPNVIEYACSNCGLVVDHEEIRRSPGWLPFHSPVFFLGFKKDLGQTLATRDAKRILAKHSKSLYEKRIAWWRAKKTNAIFTKPKAKDTERMLLEAGKKAMEDYGLNIIEKAEDPTDMAIVIANDFGRALSLVAEGLDKQVLDGRRKRPRLNPTGRRIALATLCYVLYRQNERLLQNKFKGALPFSKEDYLTVKLFLDRTYSLSHV